MSEHQDSWQGLDEKNCSAQCSNSEEQRSDVHNISIMQNYDNLKKPDLVSTEKSFTFKQLDIRHRDQTN